MSSEEVSCLFCELAAGRGEVSLVVQDDLVLALMDAYPVAPGHVLVLPRRHVERVADLTEDEGVALWRVAQELCGRVRGSLAPAVNLHLSDGAEADQEVPHVHLHVIPRHAEDRVRIGLPGTQASRDELDEVAEQLRRRPR